MSRNGKIHTKKRQFRQMPVLAFLNQRLFLQPLFNVLSVSPVAAQPLQGKGQNPELPDLSILFSTSNGRYEKNLKEYDKTPDVKVPGSMHPQ